MSYWSNIITKLNIFQKSLREPKEDTQPKNIEDLLRKKKYINQYNRVFRAETDIQMWRACIERALQPPYYSRYQLFEMYRQSLQDAHTQAQMNTRKNGTLGEKAVFIDFSTNEIQKIESKLLNQAWFNKLVEIVLNSRFWGFSVAELTIKDKSVQVNGIAPDYFCPRRKLLLPNPENPSSGISLEPPLTDNLLTFGGFNALGEDDLGLLAPASRYDIYKRFSISDWARFSERFGTPFVIGRTNTTNEAELKKMEGLLSGFGTNGWAILPEDDQIDMINNTQSGKPQELFQAMALWCDEQISKLIVGQTGTSDEKSYVGAAQVHERVLDWHITSDMALVRDNLNEQLIPILEREELIPQGLQIEWEYFLQPSPGAPPKPQENKNKEALNAYLNYIESLKKKP